MDDWEFDDYLKKVFTCLSCGKELNNFYRSNKTMSICKFCSGEYIDHCKDCMREDCPCCEFYC